MSDFYTLHKGIFRSIEEVDALIDAITELKEQVAALKELNKHALENRDILLKKVAEYKKATSEGCQDAIIRLVAAERQVAVLESEARSNAFEDDCIENSDIVDLQAQVAAMASAPATVFIERFFMPPMMLDGKLLSAVEALGIEYDAIQQYARAALKQEDKT